jgi:CMP-2-keto-3-deoxyoctulosonic acid synthetase
LPIPTSSRPSSIREAPIYFSRIPSPTTETKGIGPAGNTSALASTLPQAFLPKSPSCPDPLEKLEKLEQLRVLENGYAILVGTVEHTAEGIDTPQQYAAFVQRYRQQDMNDPTRNTPASQGQDSNG